MSPSPASTPLPHPRTGVGLHSPSLAGEGWPDDPATASTPVARDARQVRSVVASLTSPDDAHPEDRPRPEDTWQRLRAAASVCRACPRLVDWREEVAVTKRAAFRGEPYWGRPVPPLGPPDARILIVGLAPAAHGANRTGRMFTGDRSGDWLFAALHRAGLASRATSTDAADGMAVSDCCILAPVLCAPPANKPTPQEQATCSAWFDAFLACQRDVRVIVALGGIGWTNVLRAARRAGWQVPSPAPRFGHGVEAVLGRPGAASTAAHEVVLLGCYHVSQQNTFTGRLTADMLDAVLARATALTGLRH